MRLKGRNNPRTITNITERVSKCLLYCARFRSCKTEKRWRETEPVAVTRCNEGACIRYQGDPLGAVLIRLISSRNLFHKPKWWYMKHQRKNI